MMTEPPKDTGEICQMCKRLKKAHTHEELLVCTRKMTEFRGQSQGGAGIE